MTQSGLLLAFPICALALGCSTSELSQPATLVVVSGDAQSAVGSAALPAPLVLRITDVKNRGVAGVAVAWAASDADARLSATSTTTDAQGQTQVQWTLGESPGRQTVTATTARVPGAEVVFQANTGASISGGVTLSTGPLGTLAPSASARTGALLSASPNSMLVQPSRLSGQLRAAGTRIRRLIVEFKPKAMGMASRMASASAADMRAVESGMSRTLASFEAAGLVTRPEYSPVILATRVTVPDTADLDVAIRALRDNADVASVTPDEIVPMLGDYSATEYVARIKSLAATAQSIGGAVPGVLPNDPLLLQQYWHYNMIDMPRAWATATGSADVLVAVVDNGIRFTHPAISANLTTDGYNFTAGGNRLTTAMPICQGGSTSLPEAGPGPDPTQPDDFFLATLSTGTLCWARNSAGNHGLHVAGTIGAAGNDGIGVTGVNWNVKIRPVRALDITGSGSFFDIAQGVLYAAGLPAAGAGGTVTAPSRASIINMSLGGGFNSSALANAVTAATNAGSLIIASAGNSSTFSPSYPASYPEVVSVVALGPDMQLASYTNVGGTVSLAAPGGSFRFPGIGGVLSSTWNFVAGLPNYAYYAGTSMASPHVAGVAALLLGANPGMTNTQLRARLQNTAVPLGPPGRNDRTGYGVVNAANALSNSAGPRRDTYVRIVDAVTGVVVRTVPVRADGSYVASRLPAGSYFVFAGQDENQDKITGMPGRRWGWYGPASGPTAIVLGAAQNFVAAVQSGLPTESKPNNLPTSANRLTMNGYVTGNLTASDASDIFVITIPTAGTYYFETTGIIGSCGFGLELDTVLSLLDSNRNTLATNDDTVFPSSLFCSAISRALTPGTYYLTVVGSGGSIGQYRLWARDRP
ncbi:MAG TPA: S8 family serine peptidase [Gemmatimonadaceae bacterium]|nr:S8 family serine peptidase [Gemmatimonadaceae bacterium]